MLNKITLIGRVGKDPIVKRFDNGGCIAEFSIATDDSYKDKQGNKVEQADWHNIKVNYPKQAEIVEKYVKKGMLIYCEGKSKQRSYDDKDGNKRYVTEVICDTFKFLSKPDSDTPTRTASDAASEVKETKEDPANDSLPF